MNDHLLFLQFKSDNPQDFSFTLIRIVETWGIEQDDSTAGQVERLCAFNHIRARLDRVPDLEFVGRLGG